jgi:UDPglucose 6-dehydrogenase
MRITVVGTGHVGLPTAAALAHLGHEVRATDADPEKLATLSAGSMPFFEAGLKELVAEGTASGRLVFDPDLRSALDASRVAFVCVGTPAKESGEANLTAFERAAADIAEAASGPLVVVQKSTVPAGTGERLGETMSRVRPDLRFDVASNPEFLREGSAVADSLHPDRILVGAASEAALEAMREVYAPLIEGGSQWIETDLRTAELAKHASNAFLALKVSFANALARLSEAAGADVVAIAEIMGADPRIGRAHLSPGLGYGGYCFPKDVQAFRALSTRLGYDFPLLDEIARINDEALDAAFAKVEEAVWNLEGKRVAVLGLSFKPGTDDTRLSPAMALVHRLVEAGAQVAGYDPKAGANAKAEAPGMEVCGDPYAALEGAHAAVVATGWDELRDLDPERMRTTMAFPIVIDGPNLLDGERLRAAGFTYVGTGRPPLRP